MSRRGPPGRDLRCSLLVRNLSRSVRPDDLRYTGEKFGRLRDVYLPRDFYTGEPRGIGFLEYLDPRDAEDAREGLDRSVIAGREVSVVFAQQGRKAPEEYRAGRGGGGYGGGYGGRRRSYSPRRRSYSPRRHRSPSRGRSRSPRRSRRSPSRSLSRDHSRSPVKRSRSPVRRSRSEESNRSPPRSSRSRSPPRSRSPAEASRSPSRD